jgi:IPT/TIG domain
VSAAGGFLDSQKSVGLDLKTPSRPHRTKNVGSITLGGKMKRILVAVGMSLSWIVTIHAQTGATPDSRPRIERSAAQRAAKGIGIRPPRPRVVAITDASPVITGYSPLFGPPGTVLTIHGTGFGASQGNSYVSVLSSFNFQTYTTWPATTWSDTEIVVSVPSTMPLGKVYLIVEVDEQKSPGWQPFTVGIPPEIMKYSPAFGEPGTVLKINGIGFGQSQASSHVRVLSAVTHTWVGWTPTRWSDTEIDVPIPSNMPLGKVYLYVNVNKLDSIGTYPFTVGTPPTISGYSPSHGDTGTLLTINGTGFGSAQGASSVSALSAVTGTSTTWAPTRWSDTEIDVPVPSNMPLGKVYLSVRADGLESIGTFPFSVGMPPAIATYSPGFGNPGTLLRINGSGFGPTQRDSFVWSESAVNNATTTWPVTSWSDTEVIVTVPNTMPFGKVYLNITTDGLQSIGTYPFTVGIPPSIQSYSPGSGPAGTTITIHGTEFGQTQNGGYVTLQSVSDIWTTLTITSWSDERIDAQVPKLTPTGCSYISVMADGLHSIGTYPFCVR